MGESASVFHVVCRDCRTEVVEPTERTAGGTAERHRSAADHRVVFEKFELPAQPQQASD